MFRAGGKSQSQAGARTAAGPAPQQRVRARGREGETSEKRGCVVTLTVCSGTVQYGTAVVEVGTGPAGSSISSGTLCHVRTGRKFLPVYRTVQYLYRSVVRTVPKYVYPGDRTL